MGRKHEGEVAAAPVEPLPEAPRTVDGLLTENAALRVTNHGLRRRAALIEAAAKKDAAGAAAAVARLQATLAAREADLAAVRGEFAKCLTADAHAAADAAARAEAEVPAEKPTP